MTHFLPWPRLGLVAAALTLAACDKGPLDTDQAVDPATNTAADQPMLASTGLPGQFGADFSMPVAMRAALTTSGCSNNPGPQVTMSGTMALGGFGVEMIFRNNEKGTHEADGEIRADVAVIPAGQSITIPKQPVLGGTGGNPFIWVQFTNADGAPISDEIYMGRCVQGTTTPVYADLGVNAVAAATALASGCSNNPGPYITLDGDVGLGGIGARVIFRNNDNPVGGPHEADADAVSFTLLAAGTRFQIPKQPVLGGVGGNPYIWALLKQGDGSDITNEIFLGRCVQLSQATT